MTMYSSSSHPVSKCTACVRFTSGHKMPNVHCHALRARHAWPSFALLIHGNRLRAVSLLHTESLTINITISAGSTLSLFLSLLSLFPLCLIPFFLFFKWHRFKQTSILVSESAQQSACGLNPPVAVLNKVVHSAVKPLGWAVPLRTWERMVD